MALEPKDKTSVQRNTASKTLPSMATDMENASYDSPPTQAAAGSERNVEARPKPAARDVLRHHSDATDEWRSSKEGATQRMDTSEPEQSWSDVLEHTHSQTTRKQRLQQGYRRLVQQGREMAHSQNSRTWAGALLAVGVGALLLSLYRKRSHMR